MSETLDNRKGLSHSVSTALAIFLLSWLLFFSEVHAQTATLRHVVGFGIGYEPGPGGRVIGSYDYTGLGPGTVSLMLGWSEQFFGAAGYTLTFYAGEARNTRLSISAGAFSEYYPDRLLNGNGDLETDERRSGGTLEVEATLRPTGGGVLLTAHSRVQRARVVLAGPEDADTSHILTTFDAGITYLLQNRTGIRLARLQLAPRVRAGIESYSGATFGIFSFLGSLHQPLWSSLELVIDARMALVTADTPVFELASFGGLPGVRGYRTDAALGHYLWTLQNELWTPVPGTAGAEEGIRALIYQYLRLSAFVDAGGIYRTVETDSGIRAGLGAGLRLLLGPITLRLDWAHGLHPTAADSAKGRLYFTVGTAIQ